MLACGGLHTLALNKKGEILSWGRGEVGQLGHSKELLENQANGDSYLTRPRKIDSLVSKLNAVKISAGEDHSLALGINGEVYGWGFTSQSAGNAEKERNSDSVNSSTPVQIESLKNKNIEKIYSGQTFCFFQNKKREIYGCGSNDHGQLGVEAQTKTGGTVRINYVVGPRKVEPLSNATILHIDSGCNHSLGLAVMDNHLVLLGWGMQRHGQLGLGTSGTSASGLRVIKHFTDCKIYKIGCGTFHSAVIIGEVSKNFNNVSLFSLTNKI
jgi:alpha-tubulin suppressor-like RCC1 family protein